MSQAAENLRVRRTQRLLRESLIDLLEERSFESLTIGEITSRAMVSRAAFYRNYKDKYDLVERIFDEAMTALLAAPDLDARSPLERLTGFYTHIAEYERLYAALLGKRGSPWFAARMRATFADVAAAHLQTPEIRANGGPDEPMPSVPGSASPSGSGSDELVPTVLGAMFVQTITWWLEHGRPTSPRTIAEQTAQIAAAIYAQADDWTRSAAG